MQRIDWSKVHRRERPYQWFEFKDTVLGEIRIGLRKLLSTEEDAAEEQATQHIARYVTGGFRNDADIWCKAPIAFPSLHDVPITLTATSIRTACRIEAMQPPDDRHSFVDLIYMSQYGDGVYSEIDGAAFAVLRGGSAAPDDEAGNPAGEASATPSTGS